MLKTEDGLKSHERRRFMERGVKAGVAAAAMTKFSGLFQPAEAAKHAGKNAANLIYLNGKVYTVDKDQKWAQAFAGKDGKFVKVGTDAEVKRLRGDKTEAYSTENVRVLGVKFVLDGVAAGRTAVMVDPYEGETDYRGPWRAIETVVTRRAPGATSGPALNSAHAITLEEAIYFFTMGAAYGQYREDEIGSITSGKHADFIVVNQNIFEISVHRVHETKVLSTVIGGKDAYISSEVQEIIDLGEISGKLGGCPCATDRKLRKRK
jgi:predicted amidohydrolase YtcJ